MELPEAYGEIVSKAVEKFPESMNDAVDMTLKAFKKQPDFEEFRDGLVERAVRELIRKQRCYIQRPDYGNADHQKRVERTVGGRRKLALPDVANAVAATLSLDFMIDGTTIRNLFGRDLLRKSAGRYCSGLKSLLLSHVLARLAQVVTDSQRVGDVVSDSKFMEIVDEAECSSTFLPPPGIDTENSHEEEDEEAEAA